MIYLIDRIRFITWLANVKINQGTKRSFCELVPEAVEELRHELFDRLASSYLCASIKLEEHLCCEIEQYFKTGNCGPSISAAVCVNPTFLQPVTRKWHVNFPACPINAYLPLAVERLDQTGDTNHIAFKYCRSELQKLLSAFRNRAGETKLFFHPCDALEFCYEESQQCNVFDLIESSNLADSLGLLNVLNGAARKLRSHQSALITGTRHQEVKYYPLVCHTLNQLCSCESLYPTLYGLRLMDNVQWGSDRPHNFTQSTPFLRLRWKKAQPFVGVPLVVSGDVEKCLEMLKQMCFFFPSNLKMSGVTFYTPLTFCYVLSDLVRRCGIRDPSTLLETALSNLPPVFHKYLETTAAWMEGRPIWRVNVVIPFSSFNDQASTPILRIVLVPHSKFLDASSQNPSAQALLSDLQSTENHFFDNVEHSLKVKPDGGYDQVQISFLLQDCSLLKTHSGIVINKLEDCAVFVIGNFNDLKHEVELFNRPFPWSLKKPSSSLAVKSSGKAELVAEECHESAYDFTIRFKIHWRGHKSKTPSGN